MVMVIVRHKDGGLASGQKVAVSFSGGAMKSDRTNSQGRTVISGSSNSGKIYVNGTMRHQGSLNGPFEFVV